MSTGKPAKTGSTSSSILRTSLLFLILLLMIAAFGYDRFVARKGRDQMQAQLVEMVNDTNTNHYEEDINDLFSKKPELHLERGNRKVVKYSWPRAIPFQSYDYYVEYQKLRDRMVLRNAHVEVPPDDAFDFENAVIIEQDKENMQVSEIGGGGGAPPPTGSAKKSGVKKEDEKKSDDDSAKSDSNEDDGDK